MYPIYIFKVRFIVPGAFMGRYVQPRLRGVFRHPAGAAEQSAALSLHPCKLQYQVVACKRCEWPLFSAAPKAAAYAVIALHVEYAERRMKLGVNPRFRGLTLTPTAISQYQVVACKRCEWPLFSASP